MANMNSVDFLGGPGLDLVTPPKGYTNLRGSDDENLPPRVTLIQSL